MDINGFKNRIMRALNRLLEEADEQNMLDSKRGSPGKRKGSHKSGELYRAGLKHAYEHIIDLFNIEWDEYTFESNRNLLGSCMSSINIDAKPDEIKKKINIFFEPTGSDLDYGKFSKDGIREYAMGVKTAISNALAIPYRTEQRFF